MSRNEIKKLAERHGVTLWPTRLYVLEVSAVIAFVLAAMIFAFATNRVSLTMKVLDVLGLANALFLTAATYWPTVMPRFYRGRKNTIDKTGFAMMSVTPKLSRVNRRLQLSFKNTPIALLGAGTYAALVICSFCALPLFCLVGLGIAVFGMFFSARMMYIMFVKIGVPCPFCVFSACTMTSVTILMVAHHLINV